MSKKLSSLRRQDPFTLCINGQFNLIESNNFSWDYLIDGAPACGRGPAFLYGINNHTLLGMLQVFLFARFDLYFLSNRLNQIK